MARNDGIDRTLARNQDLETPDDVTKVQEHNEREKDRYSNVDIVPERTALNVHFKSPTDDYVKMFEQMEQDKIISTRGLKPDAVKYGELVFDVNSAYFYNHGGYEFAKQFYADAYKAAVEIVGGEQYILSAVMHADERNRAMSEALGEDVYHYHNFAAGTVADQNDRQYSGPAIVRSDVVFLPLDLLTQFFSLDYSYTRVTYGYLVRVKSDTVVLSDAKFIDAAAMSMEQRYNEYMKTHSESNDPGSTPNQNTDGDRDLVCLALRVTDEESANALLDTLASSNATATFLFSEEQLSSLGDLLRRVVISGNAAALRIDASGGSSRTVSAIERANNALWAACNEKARLVALYGASDKTLRAVRAAGYCPIDFDLDYSGGLPTAAQAASSIARQARSGGCIAYLGADTAVQADWSTLLSRLRSSSRLITALNELAVTKDA